MALTVIGRPLRPGLRLPLFLSRVAAGFPSPADHIEASLSLDELCVVHPAATFFLRVVGDSMTGLGIFDGDILVVDPLDHAARGHGGGGGGERGVHLQAADL